MREKIEILWRNILNNRTIMAVRQGLVSIIPVFMVAAFSMVIRSLPFKEYQNFINEWNDGFIYNLANAAYVVTYQRMSIYITLAIAYRLVVIKNSKERWEAISISITSLCCFFILSGISTLSAENLGPKAMFIAIVSALLGTWIFETIQERMKPVSILSDGVDVRLGQALHGIIPTGITIVIVALANNIVLNIVDGDSIHEIVSDFMNMIFRGVGNDLLRGFLFLFISSILWFFGIHGSDMLETISVENFEKATQTNINLIANGQNPVEIITKPFIDIFVLMGGCGTTLCLLIALLIFSRRKSDRRLAKIATLPMVFNINEIMVFGLPIIYNPILIVPFLCVPIICFFTSYVAMYTGLVPLVTTTVEWTTPVFFGGYIATGSIAGSLLQLFNLVIGVLIYRPFILWSDRNKLLRAEEDYKELVKIMQKSEENREAVMLTQMEGNAGAMAKALSLDFMQALKEESMELYYQPQYSIDDICIGAEALIRWNHPSFGMIYPPLIFKLADELGTLSQLEKWVVDRAIKDCGIITNISGVEYKISANVTGASIQNSDFEKFLLDRAKKITGNMVFCLEITEQTALQFDDVLVERFVRLKEAGYKLAIDDFSMGHTSLTYLQNSNFDMVKLDGGIVKEVINNPRSADIVESIIKLAKNLNFEVIAEYVSNKEIRDRLADIGCTLYQGWYYSKAIPFKEFLEQRSEK